MRLTGYRASGRTGRRLAEHALAAGHDGEDPAAFMLARLRGSEYALARVGLGD
jgi:hypothetical protein